MKLLTIIFLGFLFSQQLFAVCIDGDGVELKAKPSDKAKVTWVVGRYMPLLMGDRKGAWIEVYDVDSVRHWVHARHLTSKFDCLIVRTSSANLRRGPGESHPNTDLSYVKKYGTFKKIGRDEDWLQVQDEFGQTHWLHENTIWEPRVRRKVSF